MDPVVDFEPFDQSDDEGDKENTSNTGQSDIHSDQENDTDFKLHTLIPNLDIEIHAAETPTPTPECTLMTMNSNNNIPVSSIATMESLEHLKVGGIIFNA